MQNNNSKLKIFSPKAKYKNFLLFSARPCLALPCRQAGGRQVAGGTFRFAFNSGFGLLEIIMVTAIVTTTLAAFLQTETMALRLLRVEKENLEAAFLGQEGLEAVRLIRDESWTGNIIPLSDAVPYYLVLESSQWKLTTASTSPINGKYSRTVIFEQVFRNAQDKIAATGTIDPNTRKVTARVAWLGAAGSKQLELATYLTNFQNFLSYPTEIKSVSYEGASTDFDLASFPSNNSGNGDPAQSFTTGSSAARLSMVELLLKRTTASPSDIFAEIRTSPTGTVLGTSGIIDSFTISSTTPAWVQFRFADPISLDNGTKYYIRLRSLPVSTDAGSGSTGALNWIYLQSGGSSPYSGGEAIRYIGRLSNPNDAGQVLSQYDFGFRTYILR